MLNSSSVFCLSFLSLSCFGLCSSFNLLRQITKPAIRAGMKVEMSTGRDFLICCSIHVYIGEGILLLLSVGGDHLHYSHVTKVGEESENTLEDLNKSE